MMGQVGKSKSRNILEPIVFELDKCTELIHSVTEFFSDSKSL